MNELHYVSQLIELRLTPGGDVYSAHRAFVSLSGGKILDTGHVLNVTVLKIARNTLMVSVQLEAYDPKLVRTLKARLHVFMRQVHKLCLKYDLELNVSEPVTEPRSNNVEAQEKEQAQRTRIQPKPRKENIRPCRVVVGGVSFHVDA